MGFGMEPKQLMLIQSSSVGGTASAHLTWYLVHMHGMLTYIHAHMHAYMPCSMKVRVHACMYMCMVHPCWQCMLYACNIHIVGAP